MFVGGFVKDSRATMEEAQVEEVVAQLAGLSTPGTRGVFINLETEIAFTMRLCGDGRAVLMAPGRGSCGGMWRAIWPSTLMRKWRGLH